jgi:hypothetical protein
MERVQDLLAPTTRKLKSVDWDEFHASASNLPGLKLQPQEKWCYSYQVEETRMNTDPFVRKSMKLWDVEQYGSVSGMSKRSVLTDGLGSLLQFGKAERSRSEMDPLMFKAYQKAVAEAKHVFTPSDPLHRTSTPDVCDQMNLNSSAGFSYPGKKKSEIIEEAYDVASYMAHMVGEGRRVYAPPSKLALRGHLHDLEETKTRPVWVYPAEVTILEGKWAIPYYKHLEENVPAVHFGQGSMQKLAKMMVSGLATHDECTEITLDWSGYDGSVPNFLIDDAFDIIFGSFDETAVAHQGEIVFGGHRMARKNINLQRFIRNYFKKTKIMLPDGSLYRKEHGIPSGSFFTQSVGSIANWIINKTLAHYFGWNMQRLRVLGDDSSFLLPCGLGKVSGPSIAKAAWKGFGITLKISKLRIAHNQAQRKFLGYSTSAYRYERPTADWLAMVLYPERDVEFLEQSASRVLAFYLLGGCNDAVYSSFFRDYLARYPILKGSTLPLTSGIKRLFKFVLRLPVDSFVFPDLDNFDPLKVPFSLSLGDKPFG